MGEAALAQVRQMGGWDDYGARSAEYYREALADESGRSQCGFSTLKPRRMRRRARTSWRLWKPARARGEQSFDFFDEAGFIKSSRSIAERIADRVAGRPLSGYQELESRAGRERSGLLSRHDFDRQGPLVYSGGARSGEESQRRDLGELGD